MSNIRPKLFISYSHDSEEHKEWVEKLATRLEGNGVHVFFDQWDVGLGDDLALFMEQGLTNADRVMVICTEPYVKKANAQRSGGVGYEKMIISAQIMSSLGDNQVIPIIVNNLLDNPVPTFVGSRLRLYFDNTTYEQSYAELIHDLHGKKLKARPPAGDSPFSRQPLSTLAAQASIPEGENHSPALKGRVVLPLSGSTNYWLGSGEMLFKVSWSIANHGCAYFYKGQSNLSSLYFATDIKEISQITDARSSLFFRCDSSETLRNGEIVVMQNTYGYYLAVKLEEALYRNRHADDRNEVTFSYVIAPAKSTSFANIS
ncbi:toll/interleukin-1 receptor domain-containing protein [Pectobacterium versatile]|uniref:toll/interleukin-1 receptor domain-containing protein n=1 Tax=Pectobacterium versatile TaxID=2488639 RepID=UPI00208F01FA|nr:toll/interleukin-1 receptor domain-containing protein [Pectobacterium versatile]MCO4313017.1 toll/interleukin-1 receptor domain-containing protein [Pectobacterium versatile]